MVTAHNQHWVKKCFGLIIASSASLGLRLSCTMVSLALTPVKEEVTGQLRLHHPGLVCCSDL